MNDIQKKANQHRTPPRPELWDRIEEKLDGKQDRNKLSVFKYWAVAASVISILCIGVIINQQLNKNPFHNNNYVLSNMESADQIDDIYSIDNVVSIHGLYPSLRQ